METKHLYQRRAPIEIEPGEFRKLGHQVVDQLADFLENLPQLPVTAGEAPNEIRNALGQGSLPVEGTDPETLLKETIDLLVEHSLFNGHPRFWGYITSPAAPIGALGDLIAAMINANVGAWLLSPMASELEAQTVQWIAELMEYPPDCGGLLVSGGNVANFVGFMCARNSKAPWDIRKKGLAHRKNKGLIVYCSAETHTWIEKSVDQYGLGKDALRWIQTDEQLKMDIRALREQITADRQAGHLPLMVVGTAGSTGVGVIDPLFEIAEVCRKFDLWFHVDAAYGGCAACLSDAPHDLYGLREADSVAVDPHKWLYTPLEAGCVLVRDPDILRDTFSHHPPSYYKFDQHFQELPTNYYNLGPQNSRGFRALKVWLALKQVGLDGYRQMISDDIQLAQALHEIAEQHPKLQPLTHNLSITTFRFVPEDLDVETEEAEAYLNAINEELLTRLQQGGQVFLSNAVVRGAFALRVSVVNFRTSMEDIEALPGIVVRIGEQVDKELRPELRG